MDRQVRIMIVEDDSDWVKLLTNFLNNETKFIVVGVCNNKLSAIELALLHKPDVILMDLNLKESIMEGIEAIEEITKKIQTIIIAMSNYEDQEVIKMAWESGIKDYIYKSQLRLLNDKIWDVYNNNSPTLVLLEKFIHLKKENQFNKLTGAEKELLLFLMRGASINEIVKKLCKTEKTVHNQKSSILKKLGVKSYKEALQLYKEFIK